MRSYGGHPDHTPSPGPPQPKQHADDPAAVAERERVLAIIAEMGRQASDGRLDHLDRRGVLAVLYLKVKHII